MLIKIAVLDQRNVYYSTIKVKQSKTAHPLWNDTGHYKHCIYKRIEYRILFLQNQLKGKKKLCDDTKYDDANVR